MTIVGVGVDIVEIERIKGALLRWGKRFTEAIFSKAEIEYCMSKDDGWRHFAGKFSAKEAVLKALYKRGGLRAALAEVEIINDSYSGSPEVRLYGASKSTADRLGICRIFVSISHSREFAVAFALAIRE